MPLSIEEGPHGHSSRSNDVDEPQLSKVERKTHRQNETSEEPTRTHSYMTNFFHLDPGRKMLNFVFGRRKVTQPAKQEPSPLPLSNPSGLCPKSYDIDKTSSVESQGSRNTNAQNPVFRNTLGSERTSNIPNGSEETSNTPHVPSQTASSQAADLYSDHKLAAQLAQGWYQDYHDLRFQESQEAALRLQNDLSLEKDQILADQQLARELVEALKQNPLPVEPSSKSRSWQEDRNLARRLHKELSVIQSDHEAARELEIRLQQESSALERDREIAQQIQSELDAMGPGSSIERDRQLAWELQHNIDAAGPGDSFERDHDLARRLQSEIDTSTVSESPTDPGHGENTRLPNQDAWNKGARTRSRHKSSPPDTGWNNAGILPSKSADGVQEGPSRGRRTDRAIGPKATSTRARSTKSSVRHHNSGDRALAQRLQREEEQRATRDREQGNDFARRLQAEDKQHTARIMVEHAQLRKEEEKAQADKAAQEARSRRRKNGECAFCRDTFEIDDMIQPCKHQYCRECLTGTFQIQDSTQVQYQSWSCRMSDGTLT